jgi:3-oxoacyl-[acyl-carrier-protein] synthase II
MGVGMGSLKTGFTSYVSHTLGEGRFNRMGIPMLMPNSVAAWISITQGAQGINYTINAACASANIAIGEAFLHIKNGSLDTVLTGGVECLDDGSGAIMRGFDMLSTLTISKDGRPMPFSQKRSGFLFNMGAALRKI